MNNNHIIISGNIINNYDNVQIINTYNIKINNSIIINSKYVNFFNNGIKLYKNKLIFFENKKIYVLKITGEIIILDNNIKAYITSLAFSIDRKKIAVGYSNGIICIWNMDTYNVIIMFKSETIFEVSHLVFSDDGEKLVYCYSNYYTCVITCWSKTGIRISIFFHHDENFKLLAFDSTGNNIITIFNKKNYINYTDTGKLNTELNNYISFMDLVAFSPDGVNMVTHYKNYISIINIKTNKVVRVLSSKEYNVNYFLFSQNGQVIVSSSYKKIVCYFFHGGYLVLKNHGILLDLKFSNNDGTLLALYSTKNSLEIYEYDFYKYHKSIKTIVCKMISMDISYIILSMCFGTSIAMSIL
jgi:WD40 repeat protein